MGSHGARGHNTGPAHDEWRTMSTVMNTPFKAIEIGGRVEEHVVVPALVVRTIVAGEEDDLIGVEA